MSNESVCFICQERLAEGKTAIVKNRGIQKFIEVSKSKGYNYPEFLNGASSVEVHERCRLRFIHSRTMKRKRDSSEVGETSTIAQDFDFLNLCLFCESDSEVCGKHAGEIINEKMRIVTTNELRESILKKAKDGLNDPMKCAVMNRIESVDLETVKARYHLNCHRKFFKDTKYLSPGRPVSAENQIMYSYICDFLKKNSEDSQFSLDEILKDFDGQQTVSDNTICEYLEKQFGSDILIIRRQHHKPIFCFKNTGMQILLNNWHKNRSQNDEEIIKAAAQLLNKSISSQYYDSDHYPAPQSFLENAKQVVPKLLLIFLQTLITSNKRNLNLDNFMPKILTIAHAIITATKPRNFVSTIQVGLSSLLLKKFGSKELLELLSNLGFAKSYHETVLFDVSYIMNNPPDEEIPRGFTQFVFDNLDHNICTIDGRDTLHAMAGIQCTTPRDTMPSLSKSIPRLKSIPTAEVIGRFGTLPAVELRTFRRQGEGFKHLLMEHLNILNPISEKPKLAVEDLSWHLKKWHRYLSGEEVPGWNGHMELLTQNFPYKVSSIIYLPIINNPPSDYDTIFTSLSIAAEKSEKIGQNFCIVTFDQPLYLKAKEIIVCSEPSSLLSKVIVCLGSFHLHMSFLGCIGHVMKGSGIEDVMELLYAPGCIDHILEGHAYSRAVRCHLLIRSALAKIILDQTKFSDRERAIIEDICTEDERVNRIISGEIFAEIIDKFEQQLNDLDTFGPTSQLFVQYFRMTSLLFQSIAACRSGNWKSHLNAMQNMLPYFGACGHFNYFRSVFLHLQDMLKVEDQLGTEGFQQFCEKGFFVIRRTEKFWSGVPADMTIEQTYMRLFHSSSGLTRGRGTTPATFAKWLATMGLHMVLGEQFEKFNMKQFQESSEQQHPVTHNDSSRARISRDDKDVQRVIEWFEDHLPFRKTDELVSLSTGIVADKRINCFRAHEVGTQMLCDIFGKEYGNVTLKRKEVVLSLKHMTSTVKLNDINIPIAPDTLFKRMLLLKKSDEELAEYFEYELAAYPVSIFKDGLLRKGTKASFYDCFAPIQNHPICENRLNVIDGGFLLHKVVWPTNSTFEIIVQQHIKYVINNFKNCTNVVVFDGYPENSGSKGTKSAERSRREKKNRCPDMKITPSMVPLMKRDRYLSNEHNKRLLITLIRNAMELENISTYQAEEDADFLIVKTAAEKSKQFDEVFIIGEDVDLLVILSMLPEEYNNVFFFKPCVQRTPERLYSIRSFMHNELHHCVAFLHAFSGCDTTSAFCGQGKKKMVKILLNHAELQESVQAFNIPNLNTETIDKISEKFVLALYDKVGSSSSMSLAKLRYTYFANSANKAKSFVMENIPPTSDAVFQHGRRVYCQVQWWLGNKLNPAKWGWKLTPLGLSPITTVRDIAPSSLLSLIHCKCKTGCKGRCGCRKQSLKCSIFCFECQGKDCDNAQDRSIIDYDEEDENDEYLGKLSS